MKPNPRGSDVPRGILLMHEPNDWRLTNQLEYLKGAQLSRRTYRAPRPNWDHDHCEFCWAEFSERDEPPVLHEGFTTRDEYRWVCPTCFDDFKNLFEWQILTSSE
jgi:hypothetical protein